MELNKMKLRFINALLALALAGILDNAAAEDNPETLFRQAFALASVGKLAEAEEPLNKLLADTNDIGRTAQVLTFRGYIRAQGGRWQDATTDLKQAIEKDPSNHVPWYLLTPVLVQSGELVDYRVHCKAMLDRFATTTQPEVAERTAKSCLLLPFAVGPADLIRVAKVADNAVTLGKNNPWSHWYQFTKGLADYRQLHLNDAIDRMQRAQKGLPKARDASRDMCEADTYFVLAMAHHKLKQDDEARTALAHGRRIVKTRMPKLDSKDLGLAWLDGVMTYIFMHEAEELIDGPKPTQ
jgi:tetratricopeptide (TPR) repeat protein